MFFSKLKLSKCNEGIDFGQKKGINEHAGLFVFSNQKTDCSLDSPSPKKSQFDPLHVKIG